MKQLKIKQKKAKNVNKIAFQGGSYSLAMTAIVASFVHSESKASL